jgi:tRNA threonylcarbamoyladenosine biosynthesis protein TsaE
MTPLTIAHCTLDTLDEAARQVVAALGTARKVVLYGDMGAGKTTFVRAFCRVLGVTSEVSSPTFSLVNEYRYPAATPDSGTIYHLDLYRLESAQEALDIGLEDLLYDPHWCIIEWPQIIESILPEGCASLHIEATDEHTRRIFID